MFYQIVLQMYKCFISFHTNTVLEKGQAAAVSTRVRMMDTKYFSNLLTYLLTYLTTYKVTAEGSKFITLKRSS